MSALAERAGVVQAEVVEGVEAVGEPEERDVAPLDLHEVPAGGERLGAADRHELARAARAARYLRADGVSVVSRRSAPRM